MTIFDTGLLNKALEAIELHPEEHEQGTWRCETGQCLAGWVGIVSGAPWEDEKDYHNDCVINPETGESEHVSDYAERALGYEKIDNLTSEEYHTIYGPKGRRCGYVVDETTDALVERFEDYDQYVARVKSYYAEVGVYEPVNVSYDLFGGNNTREELRGALTVIERRQSA